MANDNLQSPRSDDGDALLSQHEPGSSSPPEPEAEASPSADRAPLAGGPDWSSDVPGSKPGDPAVSEANGDGVSEPRLPDHVAIGEVVDEDLEDEAERLAPFILAQIQNHLYLPMQVPDAEAMAQLKEQDPKAHKMWLKQVEKQLDHQRFMEGARYRMPLAVIKSAQRNALIALVVLAVLAGYMAYLNLPWLAGLFGLFDVVAIIGLFTAAAKDDASEDDKADNA